MWLSPEVLNDTRVNLDRKRVFDFLKVVANQLEESQKRVRRDSLAYHRPAHVSPVGYGRGV
jgi:hypothetical protein